MQEKLPVTFKDFEDLVSRLTKVFDEVSPNDLRDLMFFIKNFTDSHPIPENTRLFADYVYPEALEVINREKLSEVMIKGIDKYIDLKYPKKKIPPVVVLRQGIRSVMIYGEMNAIEAYVREQPLKAIVIEVDDLDIFETFNIDQRFLVFFVPLLQKQMEKK